MYLTEEQIAKREDLFMEMVEIMVGDLYEHTDENYEMTELEEQVAEIMMEHFVENYKEISLREAAIVSMTGIDPNHELYEEYVEMVLDESIGGVVAGAVHGLKNLFTKHRAAAAAKASSSAEKSHSAVYDKMRAAQKAAKGSTGLAGQFRKAKASALEKRRGEARSKADTAYNTAKSASAAHTAGLKSRVALKHKIDTGVANVKNKVSGAVKSGASRLATAAGRVAGSLS